MDPVSPARVAVVTGAAGGMGQRFVQWCVAGGFTVAAVDVPGPALDALDECEGVRSYPVDVTDLAAVRQVAARITTELGEPDRLITAAGIARGGPIGVLDTGEAVAVINVNLLGTIHWIDQVITGMLRRDRGEIICVASLAGWLPTAGMGAYAASKFGVVGYLESLDKELRRSAVRVLCVCPPGVATPMLDTIIGSGAMPSRAVRLVKPIGPQDVVDAVARRLLRPRQLYVFPGPGSTTLWRLRRWLPGLTNRLLSLVYGA